MKHLVIVRGGGELGTAIAIALHRVGLRVLILERELPTATRRRVAFSDAIAMGEATVERVTCYRAEDADAAKKMLKEGKIVMLGDPAGKSIRHLEPNVVVDAITDEKNNGTNRAMAPFTVALGPGYCAGRDVDVVVETARGHDLGRLVYDGFCAKGGEQADARKGYVDSDDTVEHILFAPVSGSFEAAHAISLMVKKGDIIGRITDATGTTKNIEAPLDGVLRGILPNNSEVEEGERIADVHPTLGQGECFTISDKARCVSGSVLEAVMVWNAEHVKKHRFF